MSDRKKQLIDEFSRLPTNEHVYEDELAAKKEKLMAKNPSTQNAKYPSFPSAASEERQN